MATTSSTSIAAHPPAPGPLGLLDSTIGQKAVMAVTGVILVGFLIAHFLGNALVYAGPEAINAYSAMLHGSRGLLWVARFLLLGSALLHVGAAVRLTVKNNAARPQRYRVKRDIATTYAARTMVWSGPVLFGFIVYHLAHLTLGVAPGPYVHSATDVYANIVNGFRIPWVALLYIGSMTCLGLHLFHGVFSIFQTLGINHSAYNACIRRGALLVALLVTLGNISIPLSVLLGLVH